MIKKISLFLFSLTFISGYCNDTLKLKYPRNIIGIGCGRAVFAGNRSYQLQELGADQSTFTPATTTSINYDRGISSKGFYIGAGVNYTSFDIKKVKNNYSDKFTKYLYSPATLNYKIQSLSVSLQLTKIHLFNNFFVAQSIGINYSFLLNNKGVDYEETTISSYPTQDPSSPGGWTWINSNTTSIKTDKLDYLENYFTPQYNLGCGYQIKHIAPFVNGELSLFEMQIKSPILKLQAGIKILL